MGAPRLHSLPFRVGCTQSGIVGTCTCVEGLSVLGSCGSCDGLLMTAQAFRSIRGRGRECCAWFWGCSSGPREGGHDGDLGGLHVRHSRNVGEYARRAARTGDLFLSLAAG